MSYDFEKYLSYIYKDIEIFNIFYWNNIILNVFEIIINIGWEINFV